MRAAAAVLLFLFSAVAPAAPQLDPGVSLDLARWRASRYSAVRYALSLELAPGAPTLSGRAEIGVTLSAPRRAQASAQVPDIVLDWRPTGPLAAAREVIANGTAIASPRFERGHLVIPGKLLRRGENVVKLAFESPIAESGSAVTRYRDREDGAEYVYSLLVPADASTVFPCFDQPDLKARFSLDIAAPSNWAVIGNAPLAQSQPQGALTRHEFRETEPISTYLLAFAAGPFTAIADQASPLGTRLFVRASRAERARQEAGAVLALNRDAVAYFERYFGTRYPFAKFDLVLIPEFAYGGMEHAGATFLREESILFPSDPSANDLMRRAQLLLHEASHQWFGDSITMRWFDDLWLKEGFANFMAAKAMESLLPQFPAWNAFHALKVSAYRTDATPGTTAIYQPLGNLADAKSAYGNIVYGKAPAILRQAEFYLGERAFREGVREFLGRHAYAAAGWSDLVRALERASGRKLSRWAQNWVKRRGMPRLRVGWREDGQHRIESLWVDQTDPLDRGGPWPMRVRILALAAGGAKTADLRLSGRRTPAREFSGVLAPQLVFANSGDYGYGQFLLDRRSRAAALRGAETIADDLLRALLLDSLWESVREAQLAPLEYVELALRVAPLEPDETTLAALLARLQVAMSHYLSAAQREAAAARVEDMLANSMLTAATPDKRITFLRGFMESGWTAQGRAKLVSLLAGDLGVPGVALRSRDRFRIVGTLLARGQADGEGEAWLARQAALDTTDEGRRYAYAAAAARPVAGTKGQYFDQFTASGAVNESWIEEALAPFNEAGQSALTLPFLERALAALPELKRSRKIFFVNNWLAAFIGGQSSRDALSRVQRFLASGGLDADLALKVLEAADALERTVRIQDRFAKPTAGR